MSELEYCAFCDGGYAHSGICDKCATEIGQTGKELADKDRQLAEARAEIEAIVFVKKKAVEEIVFLNQEIERKDKLIERLKCCGNCALKDLTAIPHVLTHPYRDFCAVCKDRSKWHQTIESAALSERGE
jgi:uncharacterized metal-binding protein